MKVLINSALAGLVLLPPLLSATSLAATAEQNRLEAHARDIGSRINDAGDDPSGLPWLRVACRDLRETVTRLVEIAEERGESFTSPLAMGRCQKIEERERQGFSTSRPQ